MPELDRTVQLEASFLESIKEATEEVLLELLEHARIQADQFVVIGCSTSEVMGEQIGRAGAPEVAERIFLAISEVRAKHPFIPVFQCCEHLNRALVLEREIQMNFSLDEVSVVPVANAGGSMAAYAFEHLSNACVVESIKAHAAIDIGDTLIGMHLRPVAVPFRTKKRNIGYAHLNTAYTRPKLIGGARAVYK
jgi:uncharacterized protein (TIGR01440 family)